MSNAMKAALALILSAGFVASANTPETKKEVEESKKEETTSPSEAPAQQ